MCSYLSDNSQRSFILGIEFGVILITTTGFVFSFTITKDVDSIDYINFQALVLTIIPAFLLILFLICIHYFLETESASVLFD